MGKKNFKGRCEKRKLSKCEDVCRTFDAVQYVYADLLNESSDIKSFWVNVLLDGLEGGYTSDFVCVKADKVEKFFDCIQNYYRNQLKGKGVVEPDFQERGVHDYRKDACLTMAQFEKIILHCIIFYNTKRVLENFLYTEEMLSLEIKPYANEIWNYGCRQDGCSRIKAEREQLILTLLPMATGRFREKDLSGVQEMKQKQRKLIRQETEKKLQAKIHLAGHISVIAAALGEQKKASVKHIRANREKERKRLHKDLGRK